MFNEPEFECAPDEFRGQFNGQALAHLDEIVLSWNMGGHPIEWCGNHADFQARINESTALIFRLHAPGNSLPGRIEVDPAQAQSSGVPADLIGRLWDELARIGDSCENRHDPVAVSLGRFSRGDRKVFLAYALTIARAVTTL